MGGAARRRVAFLREHSICCFCGGTTPATTEDHIPSRSLFDARQWPEGYVFPACEPCNAITRRDELILTMLSRVFPDAPTKVQEEDSQKAIRGLINNAPELARTLIPSQDKVKQFLDKRGVSLPPGISYSELPFFDVGHPEIHRAMERFGRKLACALHYKHHRTIVPANGRIHFKWFSNVQVFEGRVPESLVKLLARSPKLIRSNRPLNDQFRYDWNADDSGRLGLYLCQFRRAFAVVLFVYTDPTLASEDDREGSFTPFQHDRDSP